VRVPLKPFTLIGATTKPESLSEPFKNRFIYSFHCTDYKEDEKNLIIERYLKYYNISYIQDIVPLLSRKVETVPRRIHNLIVKIRDFLTIHHHSLNLDHSIRKECEQRLSIRDG
jgi:Holliday junction DNA helicase RuvB